MATCEITQEHTEVERTLANRLSATFSFYQENGIRAYLVGSLGRSACLHQDFHPLDSVSDVRDIDVMTVTNNSNCPPPIVSQEARNIALPFVLDNVFNPQAITSGRKMFINYKDISLEVDPLVFEPRVGQVFDTVIPTLDPNTLFHLPLLHMGLRPKDWKALFAFRRQFQKPSGFLPEELFEPFHKLASLRKVNYPTDVALANLKWFYHKRIPYHYRRRINTIAPAVRAVLNLF